MKILLDECVTRKAKRLFTDVEIYTVAEMGFSGLKNGQLLKEAQKNEFDILLTIDKNIDSQQTISKYNLSLVIFDVKKSGIEHIKELVPIFYEQISNFQKGNTYRISNR
ncbi:MAG: DUF5615 family PIN-like protein [Bacteroidota bacterium]